MANQSIQYFRNGEVDVDPDTTVQVLPSRLGYLYMKIYAILPLHKITDAQGFPKLKIVNPFTYLSTIFGGKATADIDDRQNKTLQDRTTLMPIRQLDSKVTKELSAFKASLQHNAQCPRPTKFLETPFQRPYEEYPFARLFQEMPANTQPAPDPQRVFDELLKSDQRTDHPNKISSLCIAFANIISLSLVRINEKKPEYNETSPALDLSPLYGVNDSECDLVRIKDGRGMLSPDCFFDNRAIFLPPAVSVLLILWNRNHNYIAHHLFLNHEGKKWVDPAANHPPGSPPSPRLIAQDDEIFRLARQINCVYFKNVVTEDFFKILTGLSSVGDWPNILNGVRQSEQGKGHDSTIEFSLLHFSWSTMMPKKFAEDFEQIVQKTSGFRPDHFSPEEFQSLVNDAKSPNPTQRDIVSASLIRDTDGRFKDEELARVLHDATEQVAGKFCARGTSPCFRATELLAIEQARRWNVCSLNQFRKSLGLKAFETFEEWNPDPEVARAARSLYADINDLELYPGLKAEKTMEGQGLSLGYTMTYALLVDLFTLIRSDPQLTTEVTLGKLTHWGHADCTKTSNNGAFGAWLPKLLQRNLPRNYPYDSVYSLFPFIYPDEVRKCLLSIGQRPGYDCTRPVFHNTKVAETLKAISHVFNDPTAYRTIYGDELKTVSNGYGHFLGFDDEALHDRDQMMALFALIPDRGALYRYGAYFGTEAKDLIDDLSKEENNYMTIDIVQDVINATCTRWVCRTLCGLPELAEGRDKVKEMHEKFASLYAYIFRNIHPETGWAVRDTAISASADLIKCIDDILPIFPTIAKQQSWTHYLRSLFENTLSSATCFYTELDEGKKMPLHETFTFLDRVVKSNRTQRFRLGELALKHFERISGKILPITLAPWQKEGREEVLERHRVLANILGLAVVTSVNYAQACTQAVDFYLDDKYIAERKKIIRLSGLQEAEARAEKANDKIMGYIREAQRLGQPLGLWREAVKDDQIPQGHGLDPIVVHARDRIFADFNKAHTNDVDFPDPMTIDPNRKTPSIQGMGLHKCPGIGFVDQTMPEIFKVIFRLRNLRRSPGKAGRLERISCHPASTRTDPKVYMNWKKGEGEISHFPKSLILIYDSDRSSSRKGKREGSSPRGESRWWNRTNNILTLSLVLIVLMIILYLFLFLVLWIAGSREMPSLQAPYGIPSLRLRLPFLAPRIRPSRPAALDSDIKLGPSVCLQPRTILQPMSIGTFVRGRDGNPTPIEYTTPRKAKAHRISAVDIDVMDMRIAFFVDNILTGITRKIELNKTMDCGEDYNACVKAGFSSAMVVVPPGKHNVRLEWAGNEFMPGTRELDWGGQFSRRFKWMREYCA